MRRSFLPALCVSVLFAIGTTISAVAQNDTAEIAFWQSVQNSHDPAELNAYLEAYPHGKFSALAKLRIGKLKAEIVSKPGTKAAPTAVSSPPTSAKTATAPPVHECDRLTADAEDPNRVAKPVPIEQVVPEKAIAACRRALGAYPSTPRFQFQLGIAFTSAGIRTKPGLSAGPAAFAEAAKYFGLAEKQGYLPARLDLALLNLYGWGVATDIAKSLKLMKSAAEAGYAPAMRFLGRIYVGMDVGLLRNPGLPQNPEVGVDWLRKAANAGDLASMSDLYFVYSNGSGVKKDPIKAFEWSQRAARGGYPPSMVDLAVEYEKGIGVAKDLAQAVYWYRKAANKAATIGVPYENTAKTANDNLRRLGYQPAAPKLDATKREPASRPSDLGDLSNLDKLD